MDSSSFLSFLSSRASVREFSPEPLPGDGIQAILEAARTAPSAGNREAWDVVVVTDGELREALAGAALSQPHVREAPCVLVVCANYIRSMSRYGERGILFALEDATIACTYMMLAAHAAGLGSCWTGAFDEDEVREVLDLPAHLRPVALLAVGRGRPPVERTGRMDLSEHVHRNGW
ncbi:MAG TPA: nitroreductase family protein [Methanomicrobiales archaeon]|jgi:nitroreductase|nr:nitroreductase family protein [Methanomicrobiales archaeon]